MLIRRRTSSALLSLAAVVLLGTLPLIAQEPSSAKSQEKSDAPSAKRVDPTRRVPRYFGEIGLTPDQREAIYKIRAKHQAKIEALQKQLSELQAQVVAECEGVLTDTQKQLLEQRRRAAAATRKARDNAKSQESEKRTDSAVKTGSS